MKNDWFGQNLLLHILMKLSSLGIILMKQKNLPKSLKKMELKYLLMIVIRVLVKKPETQIFSGFQIVLSSQIKPLKRVAMRTKKEQKTPFLSYHSNEESTYHFHSSTYPPHPSLGVDFMDDKK